MATVLITGASGNLGSTVTQAMLAKGDQVIATIHSESSKRDLPAHVNLKTEVIDLRNEQAASDFILNQLNIYKTIDGAILLVGGFAMGSIKETSMSQIRDQVSLNFETAYNVIQPLYQHMIQTGYGRIILIGSRPALQPHAAKNMIAYSLSKSLLFNLAEYLNADAKGKNVSVSVIVPSTIDTKSNRESMPDANPDHWVKSEEIAHVINFILEDKAGVLKETVLKVYKNA